MRFGRTCRIAVVASLLGMLALGASAAPAAPRQIDLALRFQPHLFFDRGEPWRPTNVDALLAEPGHQLCTTTPTAACTPLVSAAQLTGAGSYLDLRGTRLDGLDAAAPDLASCARSLPTLLDCDRAGRSVIYAHVRRGADRIAIDYWWFLRYNAFSIDLHEGDWEGVTVLADRAGARVKAVHFAAHSDVWRYRTGVLRLDGGRHVRVYLARGSHAAYPRPCRTPDCRQTQIVLPEAPFDGRRAWVANDPATCARRCVRLLPLTATGAPASWNAWDGRWGLGLSQLFAPPRTPSLQARYQRPFAARISHRRLF
ncbi:MAG TPA: hypothetical protein VGO80_02775 [Solirubrobacteraceae bacterium]|jgi:hypothetical protein|nr:hypothetical protein [Solirubrobacteraceae bacterium]